jgi:hypothetical protein
MPYFNRLDVCEAWYMFAMLYHEGQGSDDYRTFGRLHNIGFKPGMGLNRPENLSENGRAIFDNLIESRGYEPYEEDE